MSVLRALVAFSSRASLFSARASQDHVRRRKAIRRLLVEQLEDRRVLAAPHPLALASLNGTSGFRITGVESGDISGYSVSGVGDVNGDGFDGVIIGAKGVDLSMTQPNVGTSYVLFGKSGGFASSLSLDTLNGSNGFRINGIGVLDDSGNSVSGAGDVNGDGYDDIIIGAWRAEVPGTNSGEAYVVFGKPSFTSALALSALNGINGFKIDGIDSSDALGVSVSGAGDVNGDGFDDVIVGAFQAEPSGTPTGFDSGESYVVFGNSSAFPAVIQANDIGSFGSPGFRINGRLIVDEFSGSSVSDAGDVNGDGFDDLIIAAHGGGPSDVGESYVVFGKSSFISPVALGGLDGSNGFRIEGDGSSVSGAGDVNGDGFDDLVIGNDGYVVFGKSSFASIISLSTLGSPGGPSGFRISGTGQIGFSATSVSGAGDVNGDGFDDLILGAPEVDATSTTGLNVGRSYVIFGQSSFSSVLELGSLNGTTGFHLLGIDPDDQSGNSVSGAGDINGDGFDDVIIGAWLADQPPPPAVPNAQDRIQAGESYVVFGGNFTPDTGTQVGNIGNNVWVANRGAAVDRLIGGLGNDELWSDAGSDVLIGGQGDDALVIQDVDFSGGRRIVGGSGFDTLFVLGTGRFLNLPTIADNRIVDIEAINLDGSGNNSLILSYREVLNLSSTSNVLYVLRNNGDYVDIGTGWAQVSDHTEAGLVFSAYVHVQSAAILRVQKVAATASVVGSHVYYAGSTFASVGGAAGVAAALDTGKVLAKEGATPQLLTYDNLINSSRGINGLVFDIAGLPANLTAADFVFQMSPLGAFDEASNPEALWTTAPAPSSVSVLPGATARVVITWADHAIENRWLRVTIKANANTGLAAPQVYYIGHLRGEVTGASDGRFTVVVADILAIRAALTNNADVNSTLDLDKSGIVLVSDILDARSNLTQELTQITIPVSI
jgi:hypothetical protein